MISDFLAQTITSTLEFTTTSNSSTSGFIPDLGNPSWEGIGAISGIVLGLAAIFVTLFLWRRERQKKELSYEIISDTPLLSYEEEEELGGRLVLLFDKQPTQQLDIRSVLLRVMNSGNVEVDDEDFSGPMKFSFGPNAEVLTANVINTEPYPFEAKANPIGTQVLLEPVLLNKQQSLTIKILVKNKDKITVYAHIKGTNVRKYTPRSEFGVSVGVRLIVLFMLAIIVGGIGGFVSRYVESGVPPTINFPFFAVATFISALGMAVLLWRDKGLR